MSIGYQPFLLPMFYPIPIWYVYICWLYLLSSPVPSLKSYTEYGVLQFILSHNLQGTINNLNATNTTRAIYYTAIILPF